MDQVSDGNSQEERREWRLIWLGSIQAFADGYTQAKPGFSFVDCMSSYFDEAYLREENAYDKRLAAGYVTSAEVAAVHRFQSLAERYESPNGNDRDTRAILQDPNWLEVVAAADDAQQQLLALITDPAEREALTKPLYGRQQFDKLPDHESASPSVISGEGGGADGLNNLRRGLLVLTKPVSSATAQVPADVRRQLLPLGFHAQKDEEGITYRIGYFAMSRSLGSSDPTSKFSAFNEIRLCQQRGSWVLRLKYNKMMWLVFLATPVLMARRPISLIRASDIGLALALPTAVLAASVLLAWFRVTRWWRRL
jgi:hypothetical protein